MITFLVIWNIVLTLWLFKQSAAVDELVSWVFRNRDSFQRLWRDYERRRTNGDDK